MACHGPQGECMDGVGPRLSDSDWVQGSQEALARIVLLGLGYNVLNINAINTYNEIKPLYSKRTAMKRGL